MKKEQEIARIDAEIVLSQRDIITENSKPNPDQNYLSLLRNRISNLENRKRYLQTGNIR